MKCFFFPRYSPMGAINELSRVWSQGIYPSLPGPILRVFIAMQVQHSYISSTNSYTFRPHVLTLSPTEIRKKFTPAEIRTPIFRLSELTLYPLDNLGQPVG